MATAGSGPSVGRVFGVLIAVAVAAAVAVVLVRMANAGDSQQVSTAGGDVAAQNDARGAVSAIEQCLAAGGAYPTSIAPTSGTMTGCSSVVALAPGSAIAYFASGSSYIFSITNTVGTVSGQTFCYASTQGTVTPIAAPLTGYRPTC